MARFVAGDVVVVPFPFSDLSGSRRRPALVVASLTGDDLILCQITSKTKQDAYTVPLETTDFASGELKLSSFVRPNKLFTFDSKMVLYQVGQLEGSKLEVIRSRVVAIIQNKA